ncbi:MAG: hypothetical protein A3A61_04450 [Candidatus Woykebacteria bacterium RIFCSPLOWO2_01_FULL_43_14]|uniref:Uncharacterized protein n=2 Tax=Candidatus Woykeibacteriota TaxID=1817899 RepID=A0A1G1WU35_9BACT|nr:MAG: hypothetical protein A3J50_03525 [Candidatus Woykebacteria bacterium RIFCSPHIGHO2_02_FULL_43_16b]OGY30850.1 MAG: hypothetical protein A3A61_04450 [Candidatus Woykebacteria bacterium RIFCSPLOWO2_01_FULL_43_14]
MENQKPTQNLVLSGILSLVVLILFVLLGLYLSLSDIDKGTFRNLSVKEIETNIDPNVVSKLKTTID